MNEPTLAANASAWLPLIWSPEWGWHYDSIFNYVVVIGFTGKHIYKIIDWVFNFLKVQVNKIQFNLGPFRIDFSAYAWDDMAFDYLRDLVKMKVSAKQADAKVIKLKYHKKLQAASTDEEIEAIHQDCRAELEALTNETIESIKTFDPQLWQATITRYQNDEKKAAEVLKSHVKAEVYERKNGSEHTISMSKAVQEKHGTGDGSAVDAAS